MRSLRNSEGQPSSPDLETIQFSSEKTRISIRLCFVEPFIEQINTQKKTNAAKNVVNKDIYVFMPVLIRLMDAPLVQMEFSVEEEVF